MDTLWKYLRRYLPVKLLLPLLFIAYAGSTSLFPHVHIIDGCKIVHSHPYSNGHTHSGKTAQTILFLSLFTLTPTSSSPACRLYSCTSADLSRPLPFRMPLSVSSFIQRPEEALQPYSDAPVPVFYPTATGAASCRTAVDPSSVRHCPFLSKSQ